MSSVPLSEHRPSEPEKYMFAGIRHHVPPTTYAALLRVPVGVPVVLPTPVTVNSASGSFTRQPHTVPCSATVGVTIAPTAKFPSMDVPENFRLPEASLISAFPAPMPVDTRRKNPSCVRAAPANAAPAVRDSRKQAVTRLRVMLVFIGSPPNRSFHGTARSNLTRAAGVAGRFVSAIAPLESAGGNRKTSMKKAGGGFRRPGRIARCNTRGPDGALHPACHATETREMPALGEAARRGSSPPGP